MSTNVPEGPRWPVRMTKIAFFAGGLGLILLLIAGPGYRLQLLPVLPALLGAAIGFVLFVIAFIVGTIGLLAGGKRTFNRSRATVAIIALALVITAVAGFWVSRGRGAPAIHDITTNLEDPPAFKDVIPLRVATHAANPVEYQRIQVARGTETNVPEAQRKAFPDLQPLILPQPPLQAVELAQRAVHEMGWDEVAVVPAEGRVEATDTTLYFGFKDDVVVRVVPEGTGSRVDVRSESRIGMGDAGTNARRVRAYLAKLRELSAS
jgi:uncharacterized protein (DUF1499 family)